MQRKYMIILTIQPTKLLILFLGSVLLVLGWLKFSYSSKALAQGSCNPPADYSGCQISKVGPKIAGNIDIRNYEEIRAQYDAAGYAYMQIPVTIIYTSGPNGDLSDANYSQTLGNIQAMRDNGLYPVIRIWDGPDQQESYDAGRILNQLFTDVSF